MCVFEVWSRDLDADSVEPEARAGYFMRAKRPRRDERREKRIMQEIIVDAYGPKEQAMGWYYYLENQL
jgi:hypothetical protein